MWLLFILIILALVVYFAVRFGAGSFRRPLSDDPLEILKRRYAKGEITKEDFDRMRKELLLQLFRSDIKKEPVFTGPNIN